ncbi:MAG: acylneuraminate cytidylyltransferase family protein [Candidatus Omnitrophica bacterium]|nr:acylneuraminate cytidylyltransferase family protein [Candidatus Omnitrophota bacterium]
MKILGLIPARIGSKRIYKKNIALLNDKPLISYTCFCARESKFINRLIVSTDSEEIASAAKKYGAEVPFLRPREISQENSTEFEFLVHALNWFSKYEDYEPDLIVVLYPTSPFRKPESIDRAVEEILKHPEADSLRSVRLCSEHPYKMWTIENGYLKPFIDSENPHLHTFSYQILPKVYIQNASIYITKPSTIRNKKSSIGDIVIPFVMDEIESIDINTPLDFKIAELLLKNELV